MTKFAVALLVSLALAACSDDGGAPAKNRTVSGTCGLPIARPNVDPSLVPAEFLIDDAELARARRGGGRTSALLNIPLGVQDTFDAYKQAIRDGGFEIVGKDNEGFEAEIYLRKGSELGAVQIRTSTCDDAVIVFVNIVHNPAAQTLPSPTRGPTPPLPSASSPAR